MTLRTSATSTPLWFDVEKRYKTMNRYQYPYHQQLWFDVEKRYKTIDLCEMFPDAQLWFDVEKRYKTIPRSDIGRTACCGLM